MSGHKNINEADLRHWKDAVPSDRLAPLIRDAARAFLRSLQMRLTAHSVPYGHWTFLRILWEQDGLTQRQLSSRAGVMEPTTFSALRAMEQLGYIVRRQLPGNRRKVFVFLTTRGRALRNKLLPLAEDVNATAVAGVRASDVAATRRTLLAIVENLARDEVASESLVRRVPSTRELSELVANAGRPRLKVRRRA
ncbi:MAG: MarR family transcriptional regulator [Pseudorhodoplanes sp.]|nr:MarR family transcriptional regulator [Pseudorhodoplanes sp.]